MATAQQKTRSSMSRASGDRSIRKPTQDLLEYLRDYAREKPDVAALWCFGIGFVLGWKLKPW
jgi:hypothetical protein